MELSKKILELEHSPIRKFYKYSDEAIQNGKKVYHLNIGQPDIKTPEGYFEAIKNFDKDVVEYMPSQGIPELINGIRKYYAKQNVHYNNEDIIVTTGGSEALTFAMLCLCNEGDEVIVPEPYYTNYNVFVKSAGAKIVPVTTKAENGFHFQSKEEFLEKITDKTKAIVITNPGNPTGAVLSMKEIRIIADIAKEKDLIIISDEVYREFVYDGSPVTSFGLLPDVMDRVIIIDSVSKHYSACGARIGALMSKNKEIISNILKLCQGRLSVSTIEQVGAIELYKTDESVIEEVKHEYQKRRDIVLEILSQVEGIICQKPSGAFYLTAKLPIDNAEDFLIWMLTCFDIDDETVMFAPEEGFYATPGLGKDEIRIAYVLNENDLRKAMNILIKGLNKYISLTSLQEK